MIKEQKVLPFHCPTPLFSEVKLIAEENMITVSSFCRMAINYMVNDINDKRTNSQKIEENSNGKPTIKENDIINYIFFTSIDNEEPNGI